MISTNGGCCIYYNVSIYCKERLFRNVAASVASFVVKKGTSPPIRKGIYGQWSPSPHKTTEVGRTDSPGLGNYLETLNERACTLLMNFYLVTDDR